MVGVCVLEQRRAYSYRVLSVFAQELEGGSERDDEEDLGERPDPTFISEAK